MSLFTTVQGQAVQADDDTGSSDYISVTDANAVAFYPKFDAGNTPFPDRKQIKGTESGTEGPLAVAGNQYNNSSDLNSYPNYTRNHAVRTIFEFDLSGDNGQRLSEAASIMLEAWVVDNSKDSESAVYELYHLTDGNDGEVTTIDFDQNLQNSVKVLEFAAEAGKLSLDVTSQIASDMADGVGYSAFFVRKQIEVDSATNAAPYKHIKLSAGQNGNTEEGNTRLYLISDNEEPEAPEPVHYLPIHQSGAVAFYPNLEWQNPPFPQRKLVKGTSAAGGIMQASAGNMNDAANPQLQGLDGFRKHAAVRTIFEFDLSGEHAQPLNDADMVVLEAWIVDQSTEDADAVYELHHLSSGNDGAVTIDDFDHQSNKSVKVDDFIISDGNMPLKLSMDVTDQIKADLADGDAYSVFYIRKQVEVRSGSNVAPEKRIQLSAGVNGNTDEGNTRLYLIPEGADQLAASITVSGTQEINQPESGEVTSSYSAAVTNYFNEAITVEDLAWSVTDEGGVEQHGNNGLAISASGELTINSAVKAGIYYVTAASGNTRGQLKLTIFPSSPEVASIEVEGKDRVAIPPADHTFNESYRAMVKDQVGLVMEGEEADFALTDAVGNIVAPEGVSLGLDGTLSIAAGAGTRSYKIKATSRSSAAIIGEKSIEIRDPVSMMPPEDTMLESAKLNGGANAYGNLSIVDVDDMHFERALHVETHTQPDADWKMAVEIPHIRSFDPDHDLEPAEADSFEVGDIMFVSFYMRTLASTDETNEGKAVFLHQQSQEPFKNYYQYSAGVSPESGWVKFVLPYEIGNLHDIMRARLSFKTGVRPQTIEIGGIEFLNYKDMTSVGELPYMSFTYEGREEDAQWREEALDRIEQHRKADLNIVVKDDSGNPVEGAEVRAEMKDHEFHFATFVTSYHVSRDEASETDDQKMYKEKIKENFNSVQASQLWLKRESDRNMRGRSVAWMYNEGFGDTVKVSGYIWPGWRWLPDYIVELQDQPELLRKRINSRILEDSRFWRGSFLEWDVINEPTNNHHVMDVLGEEIMSEWFEVAKQGDPDTRLAINEAGAENNSLSTNSEIKRVMQVLINDGAPLHGLGLQGHNGIEPKSPISLLRNLDDYGQYVDDLQITEYDVVTADQQLQADHLRDYLIAAFSHPKVSRFQMWGFNDDFHWKKDGPLYDKDWNLKPSGAVYKDLVFSQWWTDESGSTNAEGEFSFNGFRGDYEVTVTIGDQTVVKKVALPEGGTSYELNIDSLPSSNADLTDLKFRGETIEGFDPAVTEYEVPIPYGAEDVPPINALTADEQASLQYDVSFSAHDPSSVTVTAEDGTEKTYTVNFVGGPLTDVQGERLTIVSSGASEEGVTYDLGEIKDLAGVNITWNEGNQQAYDFSVEVSHNGETWWKVIDMSSTGGSEEPEPYQFDQVSYGTPGVFGRYVRLSEAEASAIKDVSIYGSLSETDIDDLQIMEPVFMNERNDVLADLGESSAVKAEAIIKNGTEEAQEAVLIVALYDASGTMLAYKQSSATAGVKGTKRLVTESIAIPENHDGYTVKAFVWDSLEDMHPLLEPEELK
jgi:GH35 family endo-1,4-beta-xylanase